MVEQKSGAIVNISSEAGRIGERNEAVYAGAKAGIIAFSKAIAREVGRKGIRVNVVCPGLTVPQNESDLSDSSGLRENNLIGQDLSQALKMYTLPRLGDPEDIANAVVFLASDAASFITGQTLSVSGGYSMI